MGGLYDFSIREGNIEGVFCFVFVADGDIGEEEVCSGTGVSNCFICAQGYVD